MKISRNHLRKLIKEELTVLSVDPAALSSMLTPGAPDDLLFEKMTSLLGCLRAANLWFHAAHNLAKGPGFIGDHMDLYGEIYGRLNDDYDTAAEKGISLTGDETVACPQVVVMHAAEKLLDYPSPAGMGAEQIVIAACEMMQGLNEKVTEMFELLEEAGALSLGLNDFLAASANQYETYIYLLQQRSKG
jgi:DNA-binding ferritin-like protein